ncbi:cyclic peptide export ABC transporter [Niastella sp. OAS944]|uniref:cyclic peptide export ABC transporter n=1 Tax=Niastella sp. OAS944 TaxID=2664089 RepID=UPI003482648F|nr:cyclic peptide transporter [Chitinophagaceae bacterium OAS944]
MSNISIILNTCSGLLALFSVAYIVFILVGIRRGDRKYIYYPWQKSFFKGMLILFPVLLGVYLVPPAYEGAELLHSNGPALLAMTTLLVSYLVFISGRFFPHKNKYYNFATTLLVISLAPSVTNASLIFLITNFLNGSSVKPAYLSFYFVLCVFLFLVTSKIVKERVLDVSQNVIQDLNMLVIKKVFSVSFQEFEKLKKGDLLTILNDDVGRITIFCNNLVSLYTSSITVLIVLTYLLTINLWACVILFAVIALILFLHYTMGVITAGYFRQAAEMRGQYIEMILGITNGFKELILHRIKRRNYKNELETTFTAYNEHNHWAYRKYASRVMVSDMAFIFSIGISCFLLPVLFHTDTKVTTAYILGALYLWGPLNVIVKSIPDVVGIKVSWNRIQNFVRSVKELRVGELERPLKEMKRSARKINEVKVIEAQNISFQYKNEIEDEEKYCIGPLNFSARAGEITFVVGGNGSGKTTLAKLLTGLYSPDNGTVSINGRAMDDKELGEYFSVIFSDFYLFKTLYTEEESTPAQMDELIKLLRLQGKVTVNNNKFSTISLSRGQSKRLALLQCYLEDRPIFLFDECAADQDPEFKHFFYCSLLPAMKSMNKILIIITHDDRYFDMADKIYKMEMGKISQREMKQKEINA